MAKLKKTTLYIDGMHCPSCEILMSDKCKELGNVQKVKADHKSQKVEVMYSGTLNTYALNESIKPFGYKIAQKEKIVHEPLSKRITDASVIIVLLFILYFIAQEFNILPSISSTASLNYGTAFILGLVASTSTCMATSGALFLATIGKMNKSDKSVSENIVPTVSFTLGRILSYTFFGLVLGIIGKTVSSNLQMGTALSFFVSFFMVLIGLDMLKLISLSSIVPTTFSKNIFQKLESKLVSHPRKTALLLGAITYFLPCGFTQTVQVYALGLANPVQSALTMGIFALGTIPAIIAMGFVSTSFTKSAFYPMFMKFIGGLIFIIGIGYVSNMLSIYGVSVPTISRTVEQGVPTVPVENGYQIVKMSVRSDGYAPNSFTLKQGVPVKWLIEGENVFGCQAYLVSPKIGVQQVIQKGENVIEFTPKEKGNIAFSCGMGMYRGMFQVI